MDRDGGERGVDGDVIAGGGVDLLVGEEVPPEDAVLGGEDCRYCALIGLELRRDEQGGADHELLVVGVEGGVVEFVEKRTDRGPSTRQWENLGQKGTYRPDEVASAKRVRQYGSSEYLALIAVILASRTESHRYGSWARAPLVL